MNGKDYLILEKIEERIAQRSNSSNTYDGRKFMGQRSKMAEFAKNQAIKNQMGRLRDELSSNRGGQKTNSL